MSTFCRTVSLVNRPLRCGTCATPARRIASASRPVGAFDDHRAGGWPQDPAHRLQDGGLARAVRPDDAGDAAAIYAQVDAAQDVEAAVAGHQALDLDHDADSAGPLAVR